MQNKNYDLVKRLNEESRVEQEILRKKAEASKEAEKEQERIRKRNKEEAGGEWVFNSEYNEFIWEGERDPVDDDPAFIQLTEQEELDLQHQEEERLEAMIKEKKNEAREKRKQK